VNFRGAAVIAGQKIFVAAFGFGEASGDIFSLHLWSCCRCHLGHMRTRTCILPPPHTAKIDYIYSSLSSPKPPKTGAILRGSLCSFRLRAEHGKPGLSAGSLAGQLLKTQAWNISGNNRIPNLVLKSLASESTSFVDNPGSAGRAVGTQSALRKHSSIVNVKMASLRRFFQCFTGNTGYQTSYYCHGRLHILV
jgi:hypothetical protein